MIRINDLTFGYRKKQKLFDRLTLQAPGGNIYGLLGKNGAGKTTLLKLISGLLHPREGSCEVMGYVPGKRIPDFLREIYFAQEDLYVPPISVRTYVKLNAPFYPKFDQKQFENYMNEFQLDINQKFSGMSFGMKKKTLLSFGMATNCALLILDEPTNGLDIPSKSLFRKLLSAAITPERTFIISTHQVRDLGNLIDPIIILDNGKIIFHQSVESVYDRLLFQMQPFGEEPNGVLYAERVPGGYMTVTDNYIGEASEIDLEVLFNAVISQTEKINQLFQKEVPHEN